MDELEKELVPGGSVSYLAFGCLGESAPAVAYCAPDLGEDLLLHLEKAFHKLSRAGDQKILPGQRIARANDFGRLCCVRGGSGDKLLSIVFVRPTQYPENLGFCLAEEVLQSGTEWLSNSTPGSEAGPDTSLVLLSKFRELSEKHSRIDVKERDEADCTTDTDDIEDDEADSEKHAGCACESSEHDSWPGSAQKEEELSNDRCDRIVPTEEFKTYSAIPPENACGIEGIGANASEEAEQDCETTLHDDSCSGTPARCAGVDGQTEVNNFAVHGVPSPSDKFATYRDTPENHELTIEEVEANSPPEDVITTQMYEPSSCSDAPADFEGEAIAASQFQHSGEDSVRVDIIAEEDGAFVENPLRAGSLFVRKRHGSEMRFFRLFSDRLEYFRTIEGAVELECQRSTLAVSEISIVKIDRKDDTITLEKDDCELVLASPSGEEDFALWVQVFEEVLHNVCHYNSHPPTPQKFDSADGEDERMTEASVVSEEINENIDETSSRTSSQDLSKNVWSHSGDSIADIPSVSWTSKLSKSPPKVHKPLEMPICSGLFSVGTGDGKNHSIRHFSMYADRLVYHHSASDFWEGRPESGEIATREMSDVYLTDDGFSIKMRSGTCLVLATLATSKFGAKVEEWHTVFGDIFGSDDSDDEVDPPKQQDAIAACAREKTKTEETKPLPSSEMLVPFTDNASPNGGVVVPTCSERPLFRGTFLLMQGGTPEAYHFVYYKGRIERYANAIDEGLGCCLGRILKEDVRKVRVTNDGFTLFLERRNMEFRVPAGVDLDIWLRALRQVLYDGEPTERPTPSSTKSSDKVMATRSKPQGRPPDAVESDFRRRDSSDSGSIPSVSSEVPLNGFESRPPRRTIETKPGPSAGRTTPPSQPDGSAIPCPNFNALRRRWEEAGSGFPAGSPQGSGSTCWRPMSPLKPVPQPRLPVRLTAAPTNSHATAKTPERAYPGQSPSKGISRQSRPSFKPSPKHLLAKSPTTESAKVVNSVQAPSEIQTEGMPARPSTIKPVGSSYNHCKFPAKPREACERFSKSASNPSLLRPGSTSSKTSMKRTSSSPQPQHQQLAPSPISKGRNHWCWGPSPAPQSAAATGPPQPSARRQGQSAATPEPRRSLSSNARTASQAQALRTHRTEITSATTAVVAPCRPADPDPCRPLDPQQAVKDKPVQVPVQSQPRSAAVSRARSSPAYRAAVRQQGGSSREGQNGVAIRTAVMGCFVGKAVSRMPEFGDPR